MNIPELLYNYTTTEVKVKCVNCNSLTIEKTRLFGIVILDNCDKKCKTITNCFLGERI